MALLTSSLLPKTIQMSDNENEDKDKEALVFRIISAHIKEEDECEKKHVVYTVQVRHAMRNDEQTLASVERRYTQFLELFNALSSEYPGHMSGLNFPKKVMIGNFENKLILARSQAFEQLLHHIVLNHNLRMSHSFLEFLQTPELIISKQLLCNKQFNFALPLLENNFTLLNNVYTDRSTPVLLALCRLIACTVSTATSSHALKYCSLALHRLDGVSDGDTLVLYAPVIHNCIFILKENRKEYEHLQRQLSDLERQGMNVKNIKLLDAISKVEMNFFKNH